MSTFDKKTPHLEAPAHEHAQDTETLLLERLKNSQSESDYFRWLLFVVGFYRGIQKLEAATALLRRFIETSNNDEQKAHCHLTLGQIATDEQHFEAALKHFKTALGLNPKQKEDRLCAPQQRGLLSKHASLLRRRRTTLPVGHRGQLDARQRISQPGRKP